ncbi:MULTISPECIES: HemK2/MTQ2 family protein methyltransferase [unclassified Knoellia]|uniref:HemK2/MTQ2 family protein methyltransferase n=1 Tax=Knoellia altitudinis TaxID=3404795 RepID=UPI0036115F2A
MTAEPAEVVAPSAPPLLDPTVGALRPSLLRLPGCYPVQADTWLLADAMCGLGLAAGARVLDVCTGTGALAVVAALAGAAEVTAVDLSLRSAAATRVNARRHGASVRVLRGDLFAPLDEGETFDLIVSNPPYVPSRSADLPRHTLGRCWDAGFDGRMLVDRICAQAHDRLAPGGSLLLVHSTVTDEVRTMAKLQDSGLEVDVVSRQTEPFGPVMRSRAEHLRSRGLIASDQSEEGLVVLRATRPIGSTQPVTGADS